MWDMMVFTFSWDDAYWDSGGYDAIHIHAMSRTCVESVSSVSTY